MSWRLAESLLTLRDQIDDTYPDRSRASDGTIGDADHRSRQSDHNPWYEGHIVTALDITHDPAHGVDIDRLTDELQASRDRRLKYVIANDLIMSGAGGPSPWVWRPYHGSNPHSRHMHVSVVANPACDDPSSWNLPSLTGGDDMELSDEDVEKILYTPMIPSNMSDKGTKYSLSYMLRYVDEYANKLSHNILAERPSGTPGSDWRATAAEMVTDQQPRVVAIEREVAEIREMLGKLIDQRGGSSDA